MPFFFFFSPCTERGTLCGLTSPMSESVWGIGGHRRGKDCRVGCKRPCVDSSAPYQAWAEFRVSFSLLETLLSRI